MWGIEDVLKRKDNGRTREETSGVHLVCVLGAGAGAGAGAGRWVVVGNAGLKRLKVGKVR